MPPIHRDDTSKHNWRCRELVLKSDLARLVGDSTLSPLHPISVRELTHLELKSRSSRRHTFDHKQESLLLPWVFVVPPAFLRLVHTQLHTAISASLHPKIPGVSSVVRHTSENSAILHLRHLVSRPLLRQFSWGHPGVVLLPLDGSITGRDREESQNLGAVMGLPLLRSLHQNLKTRTTHLPQPKVRPVLGLPLQSRNHHHITTQISPERHLRPSTTRDLRSPDHERHPLISLMDSRTTCHPVQCLRCV
mmetsp:Transcript_4512/g.9990  ORF Transcript_4512/g.9990 Transcript_4512/m.9990 type:complete len:249 (-) Transcript_4512:784-1530(-)